jgi:hypothetical protein
MVYIGARTTLAQLLQRAPTGESTMQRGQIGVSQRPQRKPVSTPGWRAHSYMPGASLVVVSGPSAVIGVRIPAYLLEGKGVATG